MEITIREILKMPCLNNAKLIAGEGGLYRIVSGVTIIEAPDIADFIRGGELLLTSFYSFTEIGEDKLKRLIMDLSEKCAGLIIKLNRITKVPEIIISTAQSYNFPVIQVPKSVAHVDIMYPVLLEIFDNQAYKLNYYKEIHKKLNSLSLTKPSMDTIIKNLENILRHPVTLYDRYLNKIFASDINYGNFSVIDAYEPERQPYAAFKYVRQLVQFGENEETLNQILVPIEGGSALQAYLGIVEGDDGLTELDYISIENAITVINLELIRQHTALEVERKFKVDLISELLNGTNMTVDEIYGRANLIGLKIEKQYAVVKIEAKILDEDDKKYIDYTENLHSIMLESIGYMVPVSVTKADNNAFTVLWPITEDRENDYIPMIKSVLEKLENIIKAKTRYSYLNAGIGKVVDNAKEIAKSNIDACDALTFGKVVYGENSYTGFAELGVYKFLCSYPNHDSLDKFMSDKVKLLLDYEKTHNGQLLETLEVFLSCNLNASKAAKEMYIHHKSVVYRLEKIKAITGMDFNSSEDVLDIQFSLKINQFLRFRRDRVK